MNNFKTARHSRFAASFLLAAGLAFIAACKKSPLTPPAPAPAPVSLPMPTSRPVEGTSAPVPEFRRTAMDRALEKRYPGNPAEQEAVRDTMRQLDAKVNAEDKLAEMHRRTMVTPAPADFVPEPAARKIRLKLILEKPEIRAGDDLRFRLEMTNIGREKIDYQEFRSSIFVKGGGMIDSLTIHFYLTDSQNKRKKLLSRAFYRPRRGDLPAKEPEGPPSGLSAAEMEKWFVETNAMGQAHATFKVKLLPGETLHSIGDNDSPVENFKTLDTQEHFDKPGTYRLQVELDDRPRPLSEGYIEVSLKTGDTLEKIHKNHERRMRAALGPVSSNEAAFEVAR